MTQAEGEEVATPAQNDLSGVLRKIAKAADDVEQQDARTREQHRALGERLHAEALRARVYASTEVFPLEQNDYHPEADLYGYLGVGVNGFHLATRTEWQDITQDLGPDGQRLYTVMELENWPVTWLRLIASQDRMTELAQKLLEALRRQVESPNATARAFPAELEQPTPSVVVVAQELKFPKVVAGWQEAERELRTNPAGALRAACSLLETVCNHILQQRSAEIPSTPTLPNLYKAVEQQLAMNADEKRLASALRQAVDGIAHGRSHLSDAHGSGPRDQIPTASHAQLAVTASGALSVHLMRLHSDPHTRQGASSGD